MLGAGRLLTLFSPFITTQKIIRTFAHKSYVKLLNLNAYEESNSKN